MPYRTVVLLKFVGTVSLGLLTGISYTTTTQSIPSLLALPSASTAQQTFHSHQLASTRHLLSLSVIAATSYCSAFILSPRIGGRHPYLLWTSLVVLVGQGSAWLLQGRNGGSCQKLLDAKREEQRDGVMRASTGNGFDDDDGYVHASASSASNGGSPAPNSRSTMLGGWNGEEVRNALLKWRSSEIFRLGFSGLAFLMGVVGVWGDGSI